MKHHTTITMLRGRAGDPSYVPGCSCGWQGVMTDDENDAKQSASAHRNTEQRSADLALRLDPETL